VYVLSLWFGLHERACVCRCERPCFEFTPRASQARFGSEDDELAGLGMDMLGMDMGMDSGFDNNLGDHGTDFHPYVFLDFVAQQ